METTVQTTELVTMTESAATIVRNLLAEKNIPTYALRVFVAGGGCSGMQYGMSFEPEARAGDSLIEPFEGVKVVVDPQSATYLRGAQIDYVESLMGGGFRIENPNAVSACGCGHSFRTTGTSSAAPASGGGCGSGGCGSH
ncbi:MAG: iron-sulfur cluster insertion protein ErpA [Ardenticatenales bacterium]|nr:iron-sulfur cluster insertion protein ErpA [Ardenticatenales bacterium]